MLGCRELTRVAKRMLGTFAASGGRWRVDVYAGRALRRARPVDTSYGRMVWSRVVTAMAAVPA
ncbi:hypothetical protein Raf01_93270 [Rugosimonospora africana]|uniref:Uncharacterized protein n=1 Tax=Rugosimonospora africana TaxID=556532 RepID=A0A8J3R4G1_9ACTN|nr:hypothetical protein Raf01_93270 [Rugosimonospora africana]